MNSKKFYIILSFLLFFVFHFLYKLYKISLVSKKWVSTGNSNLFLAYIKNQDYFISLSYAILFSFSIYLILSFFEGNKKNISQAIGGIGLLGIFYFFLCFLLGCCGSPMLGIYLSLFGVSFLGFTKPLIFIITLFSVVLGIFWKKKKKEKEICLCKDNKCIEKRNAVSNNSIDEIFKELKKGIELSKCRKCGCMRDVLETILSSSRTIPDKKYIELISDIRELLQKMDEIEYTCLGCKHCYAVEAMNTFEKLIPKSYLKNLSCNVEKMEKNWPFFPGEYYSFCKGLDCPVAVSTLSSIELAEEIAKIKPEGLCIVGKTETENIGIEKLIKNTITNPSIQFLLLIGKDPAGHFSGKTILSLWKNGVDENMKVINSPGRHPFLINLSKEEVDIFRKQVKVIDMIGCEDLEEIIKNIKKLSEEKTKSLKLEAFMDGEKYNKLKKNIPLIQASEPEKQEMDKEGYFVIIAQAEKKIILVEHYSYDNKLLRIIEGKDARSIYWTIIKNGWITQLSHAAYIGKELMKAELSIIYNFKYIQDGQ